VLAKEKIRHPRSARWHAARQFIPFSGLHRIAVRRQWLSIRKGAVDAINAGQRCQHRAAGRSRDRGDCRQGRKVGRPAAGVAKDGKLLG